MDSDPSSPASLPARLADWAKRHPARLAIGYQDQTWTFADLATEASRRAAALADCGVVSGTRVGLLKPNRPDWLACAFAVWQLGGVLVPLNTLYRRNELQHALRLAQVEVLVSDASFLRNDYRSQLEALCPRLATPGQTTGERDPLPHLRRVLYSGSPGSAPAADWDGQLEAIAAGTPLAPPTAEPPAGSDAGIFFTSGSTAAPKGVVHTHASMLAAADNVADRLGLDERDRTYGYLPLFFNGGLVGVALSTLSRGGAVLLQDVFSAEEAVSLMQRYQCSVFFGWPHQAEAIAQEPSFDRSTQGLRKGPGANAPWAAALLADDHQCVGTWGMSETGPMAACTRHDEPLEVRRASHGRPMPGLEMRLVDQQGDPLPPGGEGELTVRGTSVMRTYCGMPREDCFDAQGFFHTGDRARFNQDGSLAFLGRLGDIIKTAGVNVAAAEVESVLLLHHAVEGAHVVPVPHASRGENVACFIVPRGTVEEDAVVEHCREHLAAYKVPRHIFVITDEELPTLGSGKVDRTALRELAAARVQR